jgi:Flp pilus assembly protein CpaB
MNVAKNMEVIFIAALALVGATSLANAAVPAHRNVSPVVKQANPAVPMTVVTITGKRLSAAQKIQAGA